MGMASLDHVVINAKFDIDAVAACLSTLGFALTERGHHSLGSVNHLIMFDDHYLELVGLPLHTDTLRREVLDSTIGIDGLVFKTDDAQATYDRLCGSAFRVGEPQTFSRPVLIDGHEEIARFRTTRLAPGVMAAGRVYFCEHITPQWVFRPEWTEHPNGARALLQLLIVSPDPAADAARYETLSGGLVPGFELVFLEPAKFQTRYGVVHAEDKQKASGMPREAYFAAIVVEVENLLTLRAQLMAKTASELKFAGIALSDGVYPPTGEPSLVVSLTDIDTVIEFVSRARRP